MKKERRPIVITHVGSALEDGRYPVKREVGDRLVVTADIFKEGHAVLAAAIVFRAQDESAWRESPMRLVDNDGWAGDFPLESNTRYQFTIEAWTDVFASWADETSRRRAGSQPDLTSEILEGVELMHGSRASAAGPGVRWNTLAGSSMPSSLSLSTNLGRRPVAASSPEGRPSRDARLR